MARKRGNLYPLYGFCPLKQLSHKNTKRGHSIDKWGNNESKISLERNQNLKQEQPNYLSQTAHSKRNDKPNSDLPDLPYLQSKKAGWNQEKSKNKSQESNLEHLGSVKVRKNNLISILLIWAG